MSRSASALPLFVFLFGHLKASVEIQGEDFFLCQIVSGALILFAARGKTPNKSRRNGTNPMDRSIAKVQAEYQIVRKLARKYKVATIKNVSLRHAVETGHDWKDGLAPSIAKRVCVLCEILGV